MTVKELIEKLEKLPGDMEVFRRWFSEDLQDTEYDEVIEVGRDNVWIYETKKYEEKVVIL